MKRKNILVIAAHPDDEVLGCGGTIGRHAKNGDRVFVLILGEGVTARSDQRCPEKDATAIDNLKKSAQKACARLGVEKIFTYNFPDNRFDSVPLLEIVKVIEKIKNEVKPDTVYTHYEKDINVDHQCTFKAAMVAFRPLPSETLGKIYSFEVMSSTEFSPFQSQFAPNTFVDISQHMLAKLAALKCYASEMKPFPHPRSLEAVELNNRLWGVKAGLKSAEAFLLIRERIV